MIYVTSAIIGAISGLHSACWGTYKDSLYENVETYKFIRSIFLGAILGVVLYKFLIYNNITNINLGVFFVFIMAFERLLTESLKAFVRNEKQDKYKIPSRLHFLGRTIENKYLRIVIGLLFISLAIFSFYIPELLPVNLGSNILNGAFWGLIAGLWGSAAGGAWKDAPIEGFDKLSFFRSPAVGLVWGMILSFFTTNFSFLLFATMGAERMTVEFYKTFLRRRTPGKFKATKPIHEEWLTKRTKLIIPYIFTWIVFVVLLILPH